jgi:hypothetical protein
MTVSRLRLAAASITGAACALVIGVPAGVADAGSHASCIGIEASSVSPPGSSEEFTGGMPQLVGLVRDELGQAGPVVSAVARLHEGSHEACDEATEG